MHDGPCCANPFPPSLPGLNFVQTLSAAKAYYVSANVVKASEDKTFPGAIVASLASPWGQAIGRRPEPDLLRLLPRGLRP